MQALAKRMAVTLFGFEGVEKKPQPFVKKKVAGERPLKFSLLTFLFTRK